MGFGWGGGLGVERIRGAVGPMGVVFAPVILHLLFLTGLGGGFGKRIGGARSRSFGSALSKRISGGCWCLPVLYSNLSGLASHARLTSASELSATVM